MTNPNTNFAVYMGWGNVLVPKPQPEPLLEAIEKFRPTFAPLVPTMFIGLLNEPGIENADLTCLKGCFSGSAPLPVEVIKAFEEVEASLTNGVLYDEREKFLGHILIDLAAEYSDPFLDCPGGFA